MFRFHSCLKHFISILDSYGMGTIEDRPGVDLTEAEDIMKRRQAYTEELYKKDPNDPDNHNGVITHPEPDILQSEVNGP